jgi:phage tail sheath protein FI
LEQFNNVSLDPNSSNYIARVIGDQVYTLRDSGTTSPFLQASGSFPNRSKYVRVEVLQNTINYLDTNGNVRNGALSGSIPAAVSGTFAFGSDGTVAHPKAFNENISNTNTQGFNLVVGNDANTAYTDAVNILSNQDEYDINLLAMPGLVNEYANHSLIITKALDMIETRGDAFFVIDPTSYGAALSTATAQASARDSSYSAMYWPWVQIADNDLGQNIWLPASCLIPGVYAFNDRVAAEWFAPAGLNRGGIDIAIQAERKLTHANRDSLYESNVNPIATFPGSGVVVFGQKTNQKKASALDRINVRRLLIAAKKFIASTSKFLVFEQNTAATRNRFLSIVNPYFESVQQRQGLYAFRVVMDETNNTPDVVDRNELRGQIFLQPAKTAEFIIIDFNVLPTGAAFPS